MKLTTRLGKSGLKIKDLLKTNHGLQGPFKNWDKIEGSELYYGQSYGGEPSWKVFLESGTTEPIPELRNQGVAALLFIPIGNRYLIYMFGYGHSDLIEGKTEWDFGVKVVINTIKGDAIRSLDSKSLGRKAKTKRVQLGSQGSIAEFDLDIMNDLVSQISGVSVDTDFAKGIVGSESLMMTVDMDGSSIRKKSQQILKRYSLTTYKTNFEWIDFISPVKDRALIEKLDKELADKLSDAITNQDYDAFVISYPEIINDFAIDHVAYGGFGSFGEFDYPDISEFIDDYRKAGYLKLEHELDRLQMNLYDDTDTIKRPYSIYRSLSSELEYSGDYYVFSNGIWFKLDKSYYESVNKFFDKLIISTTEFDGTGQTFHGTEPPYLKHFASKGYEVLDQIFYKKAGEKIEMADIVGDNLEIVHVKAGTGSAKLSHLFNQGLVSARLMLNDVGFRQEFKKAIHDTKIRSVYNVKKFYPEEVTIVFRILKSGKKFKVPFFSKITLYDTYQKITAMGYKFRLDWVKIGL
ncbi:DUF6119 family protein [Pedobacter sp. BG31]|uniref:DUF6119 family protein n=1 Tax=Pedobacter sp. BG31 TaxID=3349697 RepID=UPI0035F297F5